MSSQQNNPKHIWGEDPDYTKQVQLPVPSSTPQTTGDQGVANPPSPGGGPSGPPPPLPPSFWQRFNFVLVPLLFAILVFFFILLIASLEHVFLPPLALAMLLLAVGVMQGTLLYYIQRSTNQASKETYWYLTVILGYALFVVVGTLVLFGFGASVFLLILLLIVGVFVAPRAIHQVPEGSIDVVTMYGKYVRTLQPGPHLLWPLEKSKRLSTREILWKPASFRVKIARDKDGREYDVNLVATIMYQLDSEKAHNAYLRVKNWEKALQEVFVSELKAVFFKEVTPEEVKSWFLPTPSQPIGATGATGSTPGRTLEEITDSIKDLVQHEVDDWGVKIHKVDIQDVTLLPNLAPRLNLRRPVAGTPVGTRSAGVQQAPPATSLPVDQQPTIPVQPPHPTPEYPPHSESDIELLKDSYEAVRTGRVTDPDTIRMLAARFQEHLYDPNLDFFPLRAAEILYSRARYYEELNNLRRRFPDEPIGSRPTQKNTTDEVLNLSPDEMIRTQPTEVYPVMEELPRNPLPPQYVVQPPPLPPEPNEPPAQPQPAEPLEGAESPIIGRDAALAWIFAIRKLNQYIRWFLIVFEITLLIEFSLTLLGANPNNLFVGFINFLTFIPLFPFNGIVPSTKLEPSGLVIEWSTLIAMVVYFLAFYALRRFLFIVISDSDEDFDLRPSKATDERAFGSNFAIKQVRSFYENVNRQFKPWLYFSVIAIILGTLCIASIFSIPFLGKFFPISESTTTLVTILVAAGSLYAIAIVSFLQNRKASRQVDSYYFDKLIEAEKISRLTTLASRTPVSKSQERITEKIITQLLLPSDKEKVGQETFKPVSDEILMLEQKNK